MEDNNQQILDLLHESISQTADGEVIMDLISKRLAFGKAKYGHGVRIHDNINQYDNYWNDQVKDMNWADMAMEELLDGLVYVTAERIRIVDDNKYLREAREHLIKSVCAMIRYKIKTHDSHHWMT